jgi:hypothetical protein
MRAEEMDPLARGKARLSRDPGGDIEDYAFAWGRRARDA